MDTHCLETRLLSAPVTVTLAVIEEKMVANEIMGVDAPTALVVGKLSAPVLTKMAEQIAVSLKNQLKATSKSIFDRTVVELKLGFQEYLVTSYERVRRVKTLLNPFHPMEVLNLYVNSDFSSDTFKISDIDLIAKIHSYKRIVIYGLAGSGKSMFMRYLTICRYEKPDNRLPLFVELRQLNPLSAKDLLSFIHYACTSGKSTVTREQFDLALKSGAFFLVLDGFDEIDLAHRDDIERQILDLELKFPDLTVVVSGRPDPRFHSWNNFYVFKVKEFNKVQTLKLIENIEYDPAVKNRFAKEVKTKLWNSHETFLHYPLLVTIMLLTYEQFADIPDKLHVFYGQAFDTLFQRHDAQKAQYIRETHTSLTIDDFKSCFAAFCLFSYTDGAHSFTDEMAIKTARGAITYCRASINEERFNISPEAFLQDLQQAVCLLQRDGILLTFVHRSFQEYFVALFISSLHYAKITSMLDRLKDNFQDASLSMALEMSRPTIEVEWVIPSLNRLIARLKSAGGNTGSLLAIFFDLMYVSSFSPSPQGLGRSTDSEYGTLQVLIRMYPMQLRKISGFSLFSIANIDMLRDNYQLYNKPKYVNMMNELTEYDNAESATDSDNDNSDHIVTEVILHINHEDDSWLRECGGDKLFKDISISLSRLLKEVSGRAQQRDTLIDQLLADTAF